MLKTPDETKRLEILSTYDILDTPPESPFDRITRLAQAVLQTPIAMLSFVDERRQWVKSTQGFDIRELPRNISICGQAIENNEPLVLPDAQADERFRANPLVVGEPHVRFYAGAPLTASGGVRLGTLCVIDREPRDITDRQIASLQDLARLAVDQIELRKMALSDSLTGLCTRRAFLGEAARQATTAKKIGRALGCLVFDIDKFKLLNETYGNAAGDLVLQSITDVCRRELRKIDVPSRIGSEEFGVLMPETAMGGAIRAAERLREAIEKTVVIYAGNRIPMTASFGVSVLGATEDNAAGMIERCESALQEAKRNGRNRAAILAPVGDELEAAPRARIAVRR